MSKKIDPEKLFKDAGEIFDELEVILAKKLGKDFLTTEDDDVFMEHAGTIGILANHLQTVVATLSLARVVSFGCKPDQAAAEMRDAMIGDAEMNAQNAIDQYNAGVQMANEILANMKKKPTSH